MYGHKKNSLAGNPHLVGHSNCKIDRHVAAMCVVLASQRMFSKTCVSARHNRRKKMDDDEVN